MKTGMNIQPPEVKKSREWADLIELINLIKSDPKLAESFRRNADELEKIDTEKAEVQSIKAQNDAALKEIQITIANGVKQENASREAERASKAETEELRQERVRFLTEREAFDKEKAQFAIDKSAAAKFLEDKTKELKEALSVAAETQKSADEKEALYKAKLLDLKKIAA